MMEALMILPITEVGEKGDLRGYWRSNDYYSARLAFF